MGLVPAGLLARTSGLGGGGAWAGGFGLYVRAQTIGGGWQVGLGFEHLWAGASTSLWSGVGELGYALRVSPTLTVALLAGGGGGAVARPNPAGGGDIEARGGQAFGLARVSWRGSRFWFFDVDAGWQRSLGYRAWTGVDAGVAVAPFALDGPLLRVGGGIL
jgi:hypothetical protein